MIVKTRYRDIPFEEVVDGFSENERELARDKWDSMRGQPVAFKTPADPGEREGGCGGPYFKNTANVWPLYVCPHIAEIGD